MLYDVKLKWHRREIEREIGYLSVFVVFCLCCVGGVQCLEREREREREREGERERASEIERLLICFWLWCFVCVVLVSIVWKTVWHDNDM